jgi:hypothetical protein
MRSALIIDTGIMAERISHCGLTQALAALPVGDQPHYLVHSL